MTNCNRAVVLSGETKQNKTNQLGITVVDFKSQDATKFPLRQLDLNSYGQFGAFERKLDKCP